MDGGDLICNFSERRENRMTGKKKVSEAETVEKAERRFSKEQLLASERFRNRRDLTEALLDAGKSYTVKAAEEKIQNYMKGKVK